MIDKNGMCNGSVSKPFYSQFSQWLYILHCDCVIGYLYITDYLARLMLSSLLETQQMPLKKPHRRREICSSFIVGNENGLVG
jgi:hypothetical protein